MMNKDRELVLPSNSVELENTEMSYVDGGCHSKSYSWGKRVFISARDCSVLGLVASGRCASGFVGGISSLVGSCLSVTGIGFGSGISFGGSFVSIGSSLNISSSIFMSMSYTSGMYLDFNAVTKSVSYGVAC